MLFFLGKKNRSLHKKGMYIFLMAYSLQFFSTCDNWKTKAGWEVEGRRQNRRAGWWEAPLMYASERGTSIRHSSDKNV